MVEGLHHDVAGGIDAQSATEVHADRIRAICIDNLAELRRKVIESFIPAHLDQLTSLAHHGSGDRIRKVMYLPHRPPFGTGVALGQRMIEVAPHLDNLLADEIHLEPTSDHAHSAISSLCFNLLTAHDCT